MEEIEVNNRLYMTRMLHGTFTFQLVLQPVSRIVDIKDEIKHVEGARVYLRHKDDGKLFRRYTRNSEVTQLNEYQFADDAALL